MIPRLFFLVKEKSIEKSLTSMNNAVRKGSLFITGVEKLNATLVSDNPMTQIKKPGASLKINIAISKKNQKLFISIFTAYLRLDVHRISRRNENRMKIKERERENDEGGRF